MTAPRKPLNIAILSPDDPRVKRLLPIKVTDIFEASTNDFHPQGLYSSVVYGKPGDRARDRTYARIDLNLYILHPKIYEVLVVTKGLYREIMAGTGYAIFDEEVSDFVRSDVLDGETGFAFFVKYLPKLTISRNASLRRDLRIDLVELKKDNLLTNVLITLPAGLRDLEFDEASGRPIEPEFGKMYRSIISVAGSVPSPLRNKEDSSVDATRWNLQRKVFDLYKYLEDMLDGGKNSILRKRYGARRISGGTRNVISSMVPAAARLDAPTMPDIDTTHFGMYQFIKGTVPLFRYELQKKILPHIFDDHGRCLLVGTKTLRPVAIKPSQKTRDSLTTDTGIEKLVNTFSDVNMRHRPVMLEGEYLLLIYRDKDSFALLRDIESVPEGFDRKKVRPITWAELFYVTASNYVERVRAFVTRYPVTSIGSTYPTNTYLKSTSTSESLRLLDSSWNKTDVVYPEFPILGKTFIDTMSPHPSMLVPLGADFDGDQMTANFVFGDDSVIECDKVLNSIDNFVKPSGGLYLSCGTMLTDWTLRNFY